MAVRRTLLTTAFELLYGPLVLLHEPAGRLVFGPSWPGRRLNLLDELERSDRVLDVGAGSGLLVEAGNSAGFEITGVDPSPAMRRLAARRGTPVIAGKAQDLPFPDASFTMLVSSYPGTWIADPDAWSEFKRVLVPGSRIVILLGGAVEQGSGSAVRRRLTGVIYGRREVELESEIELPTQEGITGTVGVYGDAWGRAVIWRGRRD